MHDAEIRELELLDYWNTMQRLNKAYYSDRFDPGVINGAAQDLGDLFFVTEWPRLKERCKEAIDPACRMLDEVVA